jgi:hypothetical protein
MSTRVAARRESSVNLSASPRNSKAGPSVISRNWSDGGYLVQCGKSMAVRAGVWRGPTVQVAIPVEGAQHDERGEQSGPKR